MLKRFLKPKWQHDKPQVRKQAVLGLSAQRPEEAEILYRLAAQDPEPDVRRAAVKRLSELDFLRQRALEDGNAGVREVAAARYRQLLAGGMCEVDLTARLAALDQWPTEEVLAHVARRGREVELRVAAVERLHSPALLQDAAVNDPVPRVRQVAAGRIDDPQVLRAVLEHCEQKDKKLGRQLRERLQQIERQHEQEQARHAEQQAIVAELEALAAAPWSEADAAHRMRLENRWQRSGPAEARVAERFAAAQNACLAKAAPQPEPAVQTTAAAEAAEQGAPSQEHLREALEHLQAGEEPSAPALDRLQDELRQWQQELGAAASGQLDRVERYLAAARRLLAEEAAVDGLLADEAADPEAAEGLLQRIDWPVQIGQPRRLRDLRRLADQRRARAQQVDAEQQRRLAQQLEAVERQLEAGSLRRSRRELKLAREALEALPEAGRRRYEARLRRLSARVEELRDWRQFAAEPKQRSLCERMEALLEEPHPPAERLALIKHLQGEWKRTGGSDSPESRALWERFSQAADAAFDSCRGWLDEQDRLKQTNLEIHRQLAEQLERFCREADWQAVTLQALEQIRGQARQEWEAARPVEPKPDRPVQRRFEARMEQLSEAIQARRKANRERKQALVEQVRALMDEPDLRRATAAAKQAQQQWREIGPAGARSDGRLWREFRQACDALFGRRDGQRKAAAADDAARLEQARALLGRGEELLNAPLETLDAARRDFHRQWRALELPRRERAGLQRDYERLDARVQQRLHRRELEREQQAQAAHRELARLCSTLESEVQTAGEGAAAAAGYREAAEQAPQPLRARFEQAIERRETGRGFAPAEWEAAAERRRELCLRMEILAGVDSPPDERPLRMDLQVRRLNEGLVEGSRRDPASEARELVLQWYGTGPAPAEDALDARFERAREACRPDR